MKKIILCAVSSFLFALSAGNVNGQMTSHVVSINPGYTNQTFYSMSNGILSSVSNTDWDLGFQLRGFAASIIINSKNNVQLWRANKSAADWSTMYAYDTNNVVNNASYELVNSDTSWDYGAFSVTNDPSNPFDLGWGVYDFATHIITGDSVYFIKLSNGTFKKLQLLNLSGGVYNFRWADLDGSNEMTRSLDKANYTGKFFAYYSILNDVAIDREPVYNTWDLSFQQYMTLTPFMYKVTGVLQNDSVQVAKAYPVDPATVNVNQVTFSDAINTIGYDWKAFDFSTNSYIIADSTVYFVKDRAGNPWKVIFTGFGGSATGDFMFDQEPATTVGVGESLSIRTLGLYPNPASAQTRVVVDMKNSSDVQLSLMDVSGRSVKIQDLQLQAGIQTIDLTLEGLVKGVYSVVLTSGTDRQVNRLIVQ